MKVVSIVGARPQFVKLAPIARELARKNHHHVILHTGQHYDPKMSDSFFHELEIPSPDVNLGVGSGSHAAQTAAMLIGIERHVNDEDIDWVLVYGDTNSTISGALAATKQHRKVAHIEAGLRSFNRTMPEELNRIATDHLSDLLLAPTRLAVENLEREGLANRTVLVGDVMADICLRTVQRSAPRPHLPGVAEGEDYVIATIHRPVNTDDPHRLNRIVTALAAIPVKVVIAAHPRLVIKAASFHLDFAEAGLYVREPFSYPEMIAALIHAKGVVTDSGGLQKEAFLVGTPATTLRSETEWPETLVDDWNVLDEELQSVSKLAVRRAPTTTRSTPYGRGNAAARIVETLVLESRPERPESSAL